MKRKMETEILIGNIEPVNTIFLSWVWRKECFEEKYRTRTRLRRWWDIYLDTWGATVGSVDPASQAVSNVRRIAVGGNSILQVPRGGDRARVVHPGGSVVGLRVR
jgi:hypothetical protein